MILPLHRRGTRRASVGDERDHYRIDARRSLREWRWALRQRLGGRRELRNIELEHRDTDVADNEEVAIPEDEQIEWQSFWLVELYAPSHAEALKRGIKKLQKGESSMFHFQEPAAWLSEARSWESGYWNVGHFSNRSDSSLARAHRVGLPEVFSSMSAELKQLAPGITAMVLHFEIAEELTGCLEDVMEESFSTKAEPMRDRPGGQTIYGPQFRKEDRLAAVRDEIREPAREWVGERVPGFFTELDIDIPAWDLVLSGGPGLFEESREPAERWREALGYGNLFEQWASKELPGLLIGRPHNERSHPAPTVTGNKERAEELARERHRQDGTSGINDLVDSAVSDLWVLWAFREAIEAYGQTFTDVRDQLGVRRRRFGAGRRLKRLRDEVMSLSFDLQTAGEAATNDLAMGQPHRRMGVEFLPLDFKRAKAKTVERPKTPLRQSIQRHIAKRGVTVAEQGKAITEGLRVQGELLLASTNVRLQWTLLLLTIVVGAATVVATLTAH
ncbi:MAG: hypothetical protein WB507_06045 [Solirubrobacterales bacterium]